jgi:hypothetical protein
LSTTTGAKWGQAESTSPMATLWAQAMWNDSALGDRSVGSGLKSIQFRLETLDVAAAQSLE